MKTESFRSVWDALEDDPVIARAKERRSNLMFIIQDKIEQGKWSQSEVAKMLGISQPRVSDLVRGKISKFSLDMLLGFLDRMGEEVRIEVGKPRKRKLEHADKA